MAPKMEFPNPSSVVQMARAKMSRKNLSSCKKYTSHVEIVMGLPHVDVNWPIAQGVVTNFTMRSETFARY